ncbi:uncharacterized protein LOC115740026 isoform X2 [Rhodamnia argentea]|uniref:Uncharacterized protein LOC115740026 isoform X2 n=1 Tax=Rhodamnia argentea TaxID=178133 RepID=A0A8B8P3S0_9MYRT|nr:uncharacterized protein LOC115740026 isoform X2 [Rhodamnia argentea]
MLILGNTLDQRVASVGVLTGQGIIATNDGHVYMWELSTGKRLGILHHFLGGSVSCIAAMILLQLSLQLLVMDGSYWFIGILSLRQWTGNDATMVWVFPRFRILFASDFRSPMSSMARLIMGFHRLANFLLSRNRDAPVQTSDFCKISEGGFSKHVFRNCSIETGDQAAIWSTRVLFTQLALWSKIFPNFSLCNSLLKLPRGL